MRNGGMYAGRWTLDAGRWTLDAGRWTLDAGRWTLDAGRWTLDAGRWTLDAARWTMDGDCEMNTFACLLFLAQQPIRHRVLPLVFTVTQSKNKFETIQLQKP